MYIEAEKHLKPAGKRPSRTGFGHPCSSKLDILQQLEELVSEHLLTMSAKETGNIMGETLKLRSVWETEQSLAKCQRKRSSLFDVSSLQYQDRLKSETVWKKTALLLS